jgi:hypothetical protein
MEDFTLPSVGGSLKKWVHCAPILPKALAPFPKLPKKKLKKKFKKIGTVYRGSSIGPRLAISSHPPGADGCPSLSMCNFFKKIPALLFLRMWSTHFHWFQHIPALPRLRLKTSNTHNF